MSTDRSADRHTTPRRQVGISDADWEELGRLVGDRNRADLVTRLVRAFLKRPGAKMPRRSDYEPRKVTPADPEPDQR